MAELYVIVVGCGRLGRLLANRLSGEGHQVVVVDRDVDRFGNLSTEFSGFTIEGNAVEPAVLRQAGIEKADCLFATTDKDNVNLMIAQVANKIYGVENVVARVFDPAHAAMFREFQVQTISPTKLSADAFLQLVSAFQEEQIV